MKRPRLWKDQVMPGARTAALTPGLAHVDYHTGLPAFQEPPDTSNFDRGIHAIVEAIRVANPPLPVDVSGLNPMVVRIDAVIVEDLGWKIDVLADEVRDQITAFHE